MRSFLKKHQRANPDFFIVEKTTRSCVHCGLCTATCPTFKLTGNELDSPRGRIYLLKDMIENERAASELEVRYLDRCLTCLSCVTTCPVNVDYRHLLDVGRRHIVKTYQRPLVQRLNRFVVKKVLTSPFIFYFLMQMARGLNPISRYFPSKIRVLIGKVPKNISRPTQFSIPHAFQVSNTKMKVALMPGCVQKTLGAEINAATIRLLNRLGCEVIIPSSTTCCGAIEYHLDDEQAAKQRAIQNIKVLTKLMADGSIDQIVFNTSGCSMHVKDYPFQFENCSIWKKPAELVASQCVDVTELIHNLGFDEVKESRQPKLQVTYHAACSLQHAQGITTLPIKLLKKAGFEVNTVPQGHMCCGAAGTYTLLQTDFSEQLAHLKVTHIQSTKPQIVAAGNVSCINQLETTLDIPVVHTVQLLDWATGGPSPLIEPNLF